MHYIEGLDCADYRNMVLESILAELNLENGITGVVFPVEVASAESSLGNVQGADVYSAGSMATVVATCGANAKFAGWIDIQTGERVSTSESYSFPVYRAVSLQAEFVAGEVQPAAVPNIVTQPSGATYYAGEAPSDLSVTAVSTDGGSIYIKWYKTAAATATGGVYVGAGAHYTPDTNNRGEAYYYAIISNTLGTQTVICKTDVVRINVISPIVESIFVATQPARTAYLAKSDFDGTGMVITAHLSDGTNSVIYDYEYKTSYNFGALGETPVTVSYMGFTTSVPVFVTFEGDADGNGSVTVKDAVLALCNLLDSEYADLCDANADGTLSLVDILQIIKLAAL